MTNTNDVRTERGAIERTTRDGITQGHATVHGARLYFERAGQGEALVFIHAGIADHRMWDAEFYTLANDYDVIRYDLRGYGNSTLGSESVQAALAERGQPDDEENFSHAQDLYSLLRTLEIDQATLIGCSLGGSIALDFAIEQPLLTKGLVLVGAVPSGYQFVGEMPPTLQRFTEAAQQGDQQTAGELATQLWFDGPNRQPAAMDADLRAEVKTMITAVLTNSRVDFRGENAAALPAVNRLGEINAPTLVIIGDQDEENVLQAANLLANAIPIADWAQIDGAGHLPNLEKPDEFYALVVDFLERLMTLDDPESDLATGLGGAVERKVIDPEPWKDR